MLRYLFNFIGSAFVPVNKKEQIIEVLPYDSTWIKQFEDEASLVKPIFAENFIAIHHIGSTSIPGLSAKPTIDIILEVKNIDLVDDCNPRMIKLGYEAWGEYNIPGRRFFLKGKNKRTHHVHTFQTDSPDIARHLYFRDYLIAYPNEAKEYAHLKMKLANQFSHDRRAYVLGKEEFVKALEKKAIEWANTI